MDYGISFTNEENDAIVAAGNGEWSVLFDMAYKYATDEECKDYTKSIAMFEICEKAGSYTAAENLVQFYVGNLGIPRDLEKALYYQRKCVFKDYEQIGQYGAIARELHGIDEAYELVVALIDELEEKQSYPEGDEPLKTFADVIAGVGMHTSNKIGSSIMKSLYWYEKSAELGNPYSIKMALQARKFRVSVDKSLGFHESIIEDCEQIKHWAECIMSGEKFENVEKTRAEMDLRFGVINIAMAKWYQKDKTEAIEVLEDCDMQNDPLGNVVLAFMKYMCMPDDEMPTEEIRNAFEIVNDLARWKDIEIDNYSSFFVSAAGRSLANLYKFFSDYYEDQSYSYLIRAYKTIKNTRALLPDGVDEIEVVDAELAKYRQDWNGKIYYEE